MWLVVCVVAGGVLVFYSGCVFFVCAGARPPVIFCMWFCGDLLVGLVFVVGLFGVVVFLFFCCFFWLLWVCVWGWWILRGVAGVFV